MSKVKIEGNASGTGTLTISAPNTNTDRTLTLPDGAGEILTSASTLSSSNLSGALPALDGSALTGISGGETATVWCDYNGQTNTINSSYNVSSITDNGTGTHTINFTNSLSSSKYPIAVSGIDWYDYYMTGVQGDSKSSSHCKIVFDIFDQIGGSYHDPEEATFIAIGDGA